MEAHPSQLWQIHMQVDPNNSHFIVADSVGLKLHSSFSFLFVARTVETGSGTDATVAGNGSMSSRCGG